MNHVVVVLNVVIIIFFSNKQFHQVGRYIFTPFNKFQQQNWALVSTSHLFLQWLLLKVSSSSGRWLHTPDCPVWILYFRMSTEQIKSYKTWKCTIYLMMNRHQAWARIFLVYYNSQLCWKKASNVIKASYFTSCWMFARVSAKRGKSTNGSYPRFYHWIWHVIADIF